MAYDSSSFWWKVFGGGSVHKISMADIVRLLAEMSPEDISAILPGMSRGEIAAVLSGVTQAAARA